MNKALIFLATYTFMVLAVMGLLMVTGDREREFKIDKGTHESCLYGANRAKEGFIGTEFEDWNFYESCVLNVMCANPTNKCETEKIHEASKFFNKGGTQ
jgi:hypothetical protein